MLTLGEEMEFILNSLFLICFASFSKNLSQKKTHFIASLQIKGVYLY